MNIYIYIYIYIYLFIYLFIYLGLRNECLLRLVPEIFQQRPDARDARFHPACLARFEFSV